MPKADGSPTRGETIVRIKENPTDSDEVAILKQGIAAMIDQVDAIPAVKGDTEVHRRKELAIVNLDAALLFALTALGGAPEG